MKRCTKYINIPITLWTHPDLTIMEKVVLINIDSCYDGTEGVSASVTQIATVSGMKKSEVKPILMSLQKKGALTVTYNDEGAKLYIPVIDKERYIEGELSPEPEQPVNDNETLNWEEVQDKWKEYCPTLPPISRMTSLRKTRLKSAMKNASISLDELYKIFRIVAVIPFLNGETEKFRATFDWLISKSTNLTKVYEGFYAHTANEQRLYSSIMNGTDLKRQEESPDDFYR